MKTPAEIIYEHLRQVTEEHGNTEPYEEQEKL